MKWTINNLELLLKVRYYNDLFDICNQQLKSHNVDNPDKYSIIKKQAEFCKKGDKINGYNLINNKTNCSKFWGVGKDSYNNYYTKANKFEFFEKDDWIKKNLCYNTHNNYPFCNCINNEQNKVYGTDSYGTSVSVPDICLRDHCNEQAYRPSGYDEYTCPDLCIQNIEVKYGTLTDAKQSCAINKTEQTNQTNLPEPSNNMILDDDNKLKSDNKDQIKINSLFNYKNETIKGIMNNFGITFPIKSNNYDITQEDLFLLIILFIIFIFIIRSLFKQKDEPYQYYQQPYYAQQYYGTQSQYAQPYYTQQYY